MSNYVLCIPFVYGPYFDECVESLAPAVQDCVLAVDNTRDNRGVAESWNLGIDEVKRQNAEWLVVCSAAIRFGLGGIELSQYFESGIKEVEDAHIIHFCTPEFYRDGIPYEFEQYKRGATRGYSEGMFAWHLTAIRRQTLEEVGYFDPNLYPAGFEDLDYDLRLNKTYDSTLNFPILPVAAHGTTLNHGVKLGKVEAPAMPLIAYYAEKWGIHPNAWRFGGYPHPFNEPDKPLAYFPPNRGRRWDG